MDIGMTREGVKDYPLELPVFDGPLDLLLHLIRKNKIDIYDIPIHLVAEQYMDYLYRFQQFNLYLGTEFFELASTLLAIKSRMLLPKIQNEEEDPRVELVQRLEEWEEVLRIKNQILDGFHTQAVFIERSPTILRSVRFTGDLSWKRLHKVWNRLQGLEAKMPAQIITSDLVSAKDVEQDLLFRLGKGRVYLVAYFFDLPTKLHRITAFLVMLELAKQQSITIGEDIDGVFIG